MADPDWITRFMWPVPAGKSFNEGQADTLRLFGPADDWPHPYTRSLRGRVCDLPADSLHLITNGYMV